MAYVLYGGTLLLTAVVMFWFGYKVTIEILAVGVNTELEEAQKVIRAARDDQAKARLYLAEAQRQLKVATRLKLKYRRLVTKHTERVSPCKRTYGHRN